MLFLLLHFVQPWYARKIKPPAINTILQTAWQVSFDGSVKSDIVCLSNHNAALNSDPASKQEKKKERKKIPPQNNCTNKQLRELL